MKLKDIMEQVHSVSIDERVSSAAKLMDKNNVRCLAVTNAGSVVGVVTDRDLALGCIVDGHDPWHCRVAQHMSIQHLTAHSTLEVSDALQLMNEYGLNYIPVVDRSGIVGLAARADVARALNAEIGEAVQGFAPSQPVRALEKTS